MTLAIETVKFVAAMALLGYALVVMVGCVDNSHNDVLMLMG